MTGYVVSGISGQTFNGWHKMKDIEDDVASSLAVQYDFAGNGKYVYVTGYVGSGGGTHGLHDYGTLRYDDAANGNELWFQRWDRAFGDDRATSIACAGNGNTYVTGRAESASGDYDYATWRYDKDGNGIGPIFYPIGGNTGDDYAQKIALSCVGIAHVTGFSPGTGDDYLTVKYKQLNTVTTTIDTSSLVVGPGIILSGDANSLTASDDNRLVVRPGAVISSAQYPATITFEATISTSTPSELCLQVEAQVDQSGLTQVIDFWDYTSSVWRKMDERAPTIGTDSIVHASVVNGNGPYDPARFVEPSTSRVKARVRYKAVGPILSYPWQCRVDYVAWEILP